MKKKPTSSKKKASLKDLAKRGRKSVPSAEEVRYIKGGARRSTVPEAPE